MSAGNPSSTNLVAPQSSSVEAPAASPTTSVKRLLADTSAAAPARDSQHSSPSTNDSGAAQQPSLGQPGPNGPDPSSSGFSHAQHKRVGTDHPEPQPAKSRGTATAEKPTFQQTLADLRAFLMPFLKLLPFSASLQAQLKRFIGPPIRVVVRCLAWLLHRFDFGLASNLAYDVHILLWKWVINLFFREIRPRGAYRVPREGPVIFVCGPHHNQFLDPLLLMSEVRLSANRRVSFLIAEKSYHLKFIGLASKIAHSIPVARAADSAVAGAGKLYLPASDGDSQQTSTVESADLAAGQVIVKGNGSNFTKQLSAKCQIQVNVRAYGFPAVEVVKVIDDETVIVKKGFPAKDKVYKDLTDAGLKIKEGGKREEAGLPYKCLPYIDQTKMYSSVYKKLTEGGCIGIFPEGGSHDRTDFLPLKHGVAIMALGAMAAHKALSVTLVPVGLNYFHAHRFRSRAVIEFGSPITIPKDLVELFEHGGADKRSAVGKVMDLVYDGLKSVTVRAPDYDTLMVIQASRRLYKPPGQQLNLSQVVELNKRFIIGYNTYRDEPKVQALYKKVEAYNKRLRQLGLKDHQVEGANRPLWKALLLLLWRTGLISAWTIMALPGIVMNAPIFIAASLISRKKQRAALAASTVKIQARDVIATWKVLVSLGMAPILYTFYTIVTMYCVFRYDMGRKYLFLTPLFMLVAVPSFGYAALRFGEVGMDIYKSLPPLFMSLFPRHWKQTEQLRTQRQEVSEELTSVIEEFAPKLWADFESRRLIPNSDPSHQYSANEHGREPGTPTGTTPKRRSTFGQESSILQHPMSWIDEKLFGWSSSSNLDDRRRRRRRSSGHGATANDENGPFTSGDQTPSMSQPASPGGWRSENSDDEEDDRADYDEVVRAVEERLHSDAAIAAGAGNQGGRPLGRRASRTKSQLGLQSMSAATYTTANHDDDDDKATKGTSSGVRGSTTTAEQRTTYADAVKEGE